MYQVVDDTSIMRLADGAFIPVDQRNTEYQKYLAWMAAGNAPDPAPAMTDSEVIAHFTAAIQGRLDAFARTRMYDGILSACSYVASGNPKFSTEATYCVRARDATWAKGYEIMAAVTGGARPMPTLEQVVAELPPLVWPQ